MVCGSRVAQLALGHFVALQHHERAPLNCSCLVDEAVAPDVVFGLWAEATSVQPIR